MDSTKTISALISWGEFYKAQEASSPKSCPRLRVTNKYLDVQHSLTFWEKMCDLILLSFGAGDRSLVRVMTVARAALLAADPLFLQQKHKSLDCAVRFLNEKAAHYNSRKIFGLFPFPRSTALTLSITGKTDPKRCGIKNEGNTCFAAATLQALFAVDPKIDQSCLRSFYDSLTEGEDPKGGLQKLLKSLSNDSWHYQEHAEEDPALFFEDALLPHIKEGFQWAKKGKEASEPALLQQVIKNLHEGSSLQEIVRGVYLKQPLVFSLQPKHFAVSLIGRKAADESYKSLPVKIDGCVDLSLDGGNKAFYRLFSVVMYANHHYYALVPEYTAQGTIASWIEYNDSVVSKVSNSVELRNTIESNGYLLFYTNLGMC